MLNYFLQLIFPLCSTNAVFSIKLPATALHMKAIPDRSHSYRRTNSRGQRISSKAIMICDENDSIRANVTKACTTISQPEKAFEIQNL
jgi:hypothetical protein